MRRTQVSKACTRCQKLHSKCSNERPCLRCVDFGMGEFCHDKPSKRRQYSLPQNLKNKFSQTNLQTPDVPSALYMQPPLQITTQQITTTQQIPMDFMKSNDMSFIPDHIPQVSFHTVPFYMINPYVDYWNPYVDYWNPYINQIPLQEQNEL